MTSKFTSLAEIVERVYRATGIDVIPWQDSTEDILDCLRLIGVPSSYMDKTTNGQGDNPVPITVADFRGELPHDLAVPGVCRLIHLDSNYNISSFTMMLESQDLFYQSPTVSEQFATDYNAYDSSSTLVATSLQMKMDEAEEHIDDGDLTDAQTDLEAVIEDVKQAQGRIVSSSTKNLDFVPRYKLNSNYIFTNFRNGFVEMAYRALPVDEMGMPMVPDDMRFIKAVEWYLISKIDYKRWRATRNPSDEKMYINSDRELSWYLASARSKGLTPTVSMMESIKRMLLRSIPKINEYKSGFKYSNIGEQRKF